MTNQIEYLVIGAGISGLSAAYALTKQGKKVLVLEKDSYVGGRMSTITVDGIPIDLGAKFLLPSVYKNISRLSYEFGIAFSRIPASKFAIVRNGTPVFCDGKDIVSVLQFKGLSFQAKVQLGIFLSYLLVKYRNLDMYHLDKALPLDTESVYDYFRKYISQECFDYLLEPMCNAIFSYSAKEFSKAFFLSVLRKMMSSKFYSFEGGINKLCLALAQKVPVVCNISVTSVTREKDKVVVTAKDEKKNSQITYRAKKVIIAVPGFAVLQLLKNPTDAEKAFFSQVRYSQATFMHFKGVSKSFTNFSTIWFPEKENKYFISMSKNFYSNSKLNSDIFSLGLRQAYVQELKRKKSFNKDYIAKVIEKELDMKNVDIFHITQWDGMCPMVEPGYLKRRYDFFEQTKNERQIFYCGDYLENPSTEGALTSGLNLVNKISI